MKNPMKKTISIVLSCLAVCLLCFPVNIMANEPFDLNEGEIINLYYHNVELDKLYSEFEKDGAELVEATMGSTRSTNNIFASQVQELQKINTNENAVYTQSIKKYRMPFSRAGAKINTVVKGAHEAYCYITVTNVSGNLYDVFVSISSVIPVLDTSGYKFASVGTINARLTDGKTVLRIDQALQFEYTESFSGGVSVGWVSFSAGGSIHYRGPSDYIQSVYKLPAYGLVS